MAVTPQSSGNPKHPAHIEVIDSLRAIAILAVAYFHFTNLGDYLQDGWIKKIGSYGDWGVHIFFVISGFIIPYTLCRNRYQIGLFFAFVTKRVVRLDPPYLLAAAAALFLALASTWSPYYRGSGYVIDWPAVLMHFGYLNPFFERSWLDGVYWSLGVEFQYYVFMGIAFPFLFHSKKSIRYLAIALFTGAQYFASRGAFLQDYVCLFAFGIVACQYFFKLVSLYELLIAWAFISVVAFFFAPIHFIGVGFFTGSSILFLRYTHPVLKFYGTISYSFYLTHSMIGNRILNVWEGYTLKQQIDRPFWLNISVILATFVLCTLFAYIMFRFVEKPSRKFAGNIKYEPLREQLGKRFS